MSADTGLESTRILNLGSPMVRIFARKAQEMAAVRTLELVPAAYALVQELIEPIESVQDRRKASRIIARGAGSTNQRFAVLAAAARSHGIATRVHGLAVESATSPLLAWPEFFVQDHWRDASEVLGVEQPRSVRQDLGTFASPDELFEKHAQGSGIRRFVTEVQLARRSA